MRLTTAWRRVLRATTATVLTGALGTGLLTIGATAPATAATAPIDATCGTWVLQQVSGTTQLNRMATNIQNALGHPGVVGLSLRVPWDAYEADPAVLDAGLRIAQAEGKQLSIRFMAGRSTPTRVFNAGAHSYVSSVGRVPVPFSPTGAAGNPVFEREFAATVSELATWSRANGVSLLHLPWYGFQWAEIYNGEEVEGAPGYSWDAWLQGHRTLARIARDVAGDDLVVEFPLSGHWGSRRTGSADVSDMLVDVFGANNPSLVVQGNGMGRYDQATTNRPITHAKQMYGTGDYDWASIYSTLVANDEKYLEVYTESFSASRASQLFAQAEDFAANHCGTTTPPTTPVLSVAPVARPEGDEGASQVPVTFRLSSPSTQPVSATYATAAGSASPGVDYTSSSGTVQFPAGVTSVVRTLPVLGDTAHEPDETFKVVTRSPVGATLGTSSATVTIDNDDDAAGSVPSLTIGNVRTTERDVDHRITVPVRLSAATDAPVSVRFATVAGSAGAGSDFVAASDVVRIPAGSTTASIPVTVVGDRRVEERERFRVRLSEPSGATILDGVAGVRIRNDD